MMLMNRKAFRKHGVNPGKPITAADFTVLMGSGEFVSKLCVKGNDWGVCFKLIDPKDGALFWEDAPEQAPQLELALASAEDANRITYYFDGMIRGARAALACMRSGGAEDDKRGG